MPRRGASNETEPVVDSATEAEVESALNGEGTEEVVEDENPNEVVDLSGLWDAVTATTLTADEEDNDTTDYKPVVDAYTALTRKGKAAATREFKDRMTTALDDGDFDLARKYHLTERATKENKAKSDRAPRTPADPTADFVNALASFQIAYSIRKNSIPDNIAEDWEIQLADQVNGSGESVAALLAYNDADPETRGEAPEVSEAVAKAVRLAGSNPRRTYGTRHNVGKHIDQVMTAYNAGEWLSIADLSAATSEEYGEDSASIAAITAKLKSGNYVSEIARAEILDGKLGAVRI